MHCKASELFVKTNANTKALPRLQAIVLSEKDIVFLGSHITGTRMPAQNRAANFPI
jgi:hypothetical protein